MTTLFLIVFTVYVVISRIFLLFYPQTLFFLVPFGIFIALLLTYRNKSYFPLSSLVIIPPVISLLEAHLSFLSLIDRTVIMYAVMAGLGLAYVILSKRSYIFTYSKFFPLLIISSSILGIVLGYAVISFPMTLLSLYSVKYPLMLLLFPVLFAFAEEILFRGVYVETVYKETKNFLAILIPSLIASSFAITYNLHLFAVFFLIQVAISSWYLLTRSFWASFICNATAKLIVSTMFFISAYSVVTPIGS